MNVVTLSITRLPPGKSSQRFLVIWWQVRLPRVLLPATTSAGRRGSEEPVIETWYDDSSTAPQAIRRVGAVIAGTHRCFPAVPRFEQRLN